MTPLFLRFWTVRKSMVDPSPICYSFGLRCSLKEIQSGEGISGKKRK